MISPLGARSALVAVAAALLLTLDAQARDPLLTIDPVVQVGSKLTPGSGSGPALFGATVALSADGSTALIGGQADNNDTGAAWVFTLNGGTWTQQGSKLVAPGGPPEGVFGASVALSADGNVALVGEPQLDDMAAGPGLVWVFVRSNGKWTPSAKLAASDETGNGAFGSSVSLSADGNTALIGGRNDSTGKGAAWIFERSGSTWTQLGNKLVAADETGPALFGTSVALSADATTAVIGGLNDAGVTGAAWVFTRSGTAWTEQGSKLTGGGEAGSGLFGISVAVSGDGSTALVGGYGDNAGVGAAWVFARGSGGTWTQQGSKLTASGEKGAGSFGTSVALSSNGATALIGAPFAGSGIGSAWLFRNSAGAWAQSSALAGGGELGAGLFGTAVALSQDGGTAFVGGREDDDQNTDAPALRRNAGVGAAWPFVSSGQAAAKLVLTLAAAKTAKVGDRVSLGFTLTNAGSAADRSVVLSSKTSGGPVSVASNSSRCTLRSGEATCSIGTLAHGAAVTRSVEFTPRRPGTYTTTVTIAGSLLDLAPGQYVVTTKVGR